MSQFTSFQDIKSTYPTLSSLSVRVHGGLYGKDEPFNHTFTGDDLTPQNRFPTIFSCTNRRIKNGCTGTFDVASSIYHALQKGLNDYDHSRVCNTVAPGMVQSCPNMCKVEIQATY